MDGYFTADGIVFGLIHMQISLLFQIWPLILHCFFHLALVCLGSL